MRNRGRPEDSGAMRTGCREVWRRGEPAGTNRAEGRTLGDQPYDLVSKGFVIQYLWSLDFIRE